MSGEHDLARLIATMEPILDPQRYVFATRAEADGLPSIMRFEEAEGVTLIMTEAAAAEAGVDAVFPCRRITLSVHSALDAVGFIAKVATRLAAAGMGVNPVAGYFHDHLFVPADRAEDAMAILREMSDEAK